MSASPKPKSDDLDQFFADIEAGICPFCKEPMEKEQVGRSVYASPCWHRLYQGMV